MGNHGGLPFPEALVSANLVADWELSHVVCQLYSLPFVTSEIATPDPEAQKGLDVEFLFENGIVPLSRHGRILTLCMPAIVPAEILGCIAAESDLVVLVVVGTVNSNRRWIQQNAAPEESLRGEGPDLSAEGSEWGNLFDEADAAVLSDLDGEIEMEDLIDITELAEELTETQPTELKDEKPKPSLTALPPPLKRMGESNDEPIL